MPHYHFHSADGGRALDTADAELLNDHAARVMAMKYAGEVLKGASDELWANGQWRVEATDASGALLLTVVTIMVDAPRLTDVYPKEAAND